MLSLVNPKTFELAVQNLKEAFAGTAAQMSIVEPNGFGISPPDGAAYDYDPEAVKNNQNFNYPTYIHHPQTSEEFFGFAAKLAREFPDKWVATMAYAGREMPPQGVKLPPNVTVIYAPDRLLRAAPRQRSRLLAPERNDDASCGSGASSRRTSYLYDYNPGFLLGSFVPERDVANFTENVKLYKEMSSRASTPKAARRSCRPGSATTSAAS